MSSDEKGGLEPELPRKNVVGLFCGAAFHDLVFARVVRIEILTARLPFFRKIRTEDPRKKALGRILTGTC